jgi:hypothetical protein
MSCFGSRRVVPLEDDTWSSEWRLPPTMRIVLEDGRVVFVPPNYAHLIVAR